MNTSLDQLRIKPIASSDGLHIPFRILVLYENEFSGDRAMQLHQRIFAHAAGDCLVENYRWDLKHPEALEGLVEAITMADMIIVAGSDASELPVEIQASLDVGLSQRRIENGALVALIGRRPSCNDSPSPMHFSLHELAHRTGLVFFPGAFELPEEKHTYNFETIHDRAERMTPTLQRILQHEVPSDHFGINE